VNLRGQPERPDPLIVVIIFAVNLLRVRDALADNTHVAVIHSRQMREDWSRIGAEFADDDACGLC
jgi:hypothetical protein